MPAVDMNTSGDFVVVWNSELFSEVFGQRYAATGVAQGTEFQINTFTTSSQSTRSVALETDGDFEVAWQRVDFYGWCPRCAAAKREGTPSRA